MKIMTVSGEAELFCTSELWWNLLMRRNFPQQKKIYPFY